MAPPKRKSRRSAQKGKPKPPPKPWQQVTTWIVTHFAAGYVIATVTLGALFLLTASLGTVTKDDMAAAGAIRASLGNEHVFPFIPPMRTQTLPALLQISSDGGARILCGVVPESGVVSKSVRISNRFGKNMQGVLNAMEWVVGLFYEIHFPTTLRATANEVLDPNFAQQTVILQAPDVLKALDKPACSAVITAFLANDKDALICATTWFLRSPNGQEILAAGVDKRCITLPGESKPRLLERLGPLSQGHDPTPLFTRIKIQLGFLHAEADHN